MNRGAEPSRIQSVKVSEDPPFIMLRFLKTARWNGSAKKGGHKKAVSKSARQ
jgi:hypothetical protein